MEQQNNLFDVIVVGGGIVGAATAYQISQEFPHFSIALLEKENSVATHQTGNNSGVLHSGLYYKPGSKKAINCVSGRKQLVAFAQQHQIKVDVCGKIVVATKAEQLPYLAKIFDNGLANQTEGIEKINSQQIQDIEPFVKGIAGIWVPCTGIIDFKGATQKMVELFLQMNPANKFIQLAEVKKIQQTETIAIITQNNRYNAKQAIFCGGLQADRLAKLDGVKTDVKIVGFRGDYYDLTPEAKHKVRNLIYPVPNPKVPFLGVHFTRMYTGDIECGPNAVFTFKREGYGKMDFSWKDTTEALKYKGTWRLFANHWRFGLKEYQRAFSKKKFLKELQQIIPTLTDTDIVASRSGVRAMAITVDGKMLDDFEIICHKNAIHVLNAPSPAATACLAIAKDIVNLAKKQYHWLPN